MQQRVQILHRRDTPSSATQLPIMEALYAEDLTLFVPILQDMDSNVKPLFFPFGIFVPIVQYGLPLRVSINALFYPEAKIPARKNKTNVL